MAEKKGYTTTKWNKLPNYECNDCPYATLDEDNMKDHVRLHDGDAVVAAANEGGGTK